MPILYRKLRRDIIHLRGQAFTIAIVIGCGVAAFVAMRSMYRSLLITQQDYYEQYRFADLFAELKRAPTWVAERIRHIPGVRQVSTRVVMDVTLDVPGLDEPAVGRLISIPPLHPATLNALVLRRGRYISSVAKNEVLASEAFADANNLAPGDTLHAIVNGRWVELRIVGIALSPEYIYEIRGSGSLFPDNRRFGVLWMSADALEPALNMKGAFNSIAVSLTPGANKADVISRMDQYLDRYGTLGTYDRNDQLSHRFISDEIAQNRITAMIIPAIFLAVAALLVHLSFTRLVNTQRSEIAVLKAFGYSNWQIGLHYIQFSVVIATCGYIVGCMAGWYFGVRLASVYADFYRFPLLVYRPELRVLGWAGIISGITAVAGATAATSRAVSLPPAEAMRPDSPVRFRPMWVDRWRLSFISPTLCMIIRSLERRPWRALASAFAISCSVMIVVVEFGMFDALDRMMEVQFRDSQREDIMVTLNEVRSSRAQNELAGLAGVIRAEPFRAVPVRLRFEHRWRKTSVLGLPANSELHVIVDKGGVRHAVPPGGILLSNMLAERLGIVPGQRLQVEVLEGKRPVRQVIVAGTVEELLGTNAYMNLPTLNHLLGEDHSVSGAFLQVDSTKQQQVYRKLKQLPFVAAVSIKSAALQSFEDTIDRSMAISIGTLMFFASIIAIGMIYNGARIALSERARELATLRILGFTRHEITFILLGEQAAITILALPFGFAAGYALCAVLASRLETELYRMPLIVRPESYGWAFMIVLFAAIASGILVSLRVAKLDIITVLKARE